jgi:hypothetical protein
MAPKVVITGDAADKATEQLNSSTSLKITKADDGTLKADGKAETKADKALLTAINDENVTVNVNATSSNTNVINGEEKDLIIGSFGGNTVNDDGTVTAETTVNPNQTEIAGEFYGVEAGTYVAHEISESFNAAVDFPGTQAVTFQDVINKTPNAKAYTKSHNKAIKIDGRYVEPMVIGDNSSGIGTYKLEKMKSFPGNVQLPFETTLFKKQ